MALSVEFAVPKNGCIARLESELADRKVTVSAEKEIPYGYKLTCKGEGGDFSLVLYYNNKSPLCTKLVQQGGPEQLLKGLEVKNTAPAVQPAFAHPEVKQIPKMGCHIGTDESGKGDFFGSLVVAGVYTDERTAKLLGLFGVQDSKLSSDKQNRELAANIIDALPPEDMEIICISPEKYNLLYARCGNLNTLLAWAHARVIENLLLRHEACGNVIADQFGAEFVLKKALMPLGRAANVLQTPKGERDIAVAAASVLARDKYLGELARLNRAAAKDMPEGFVLPKGAGANADAAARAFAAMHGKEALKGYAKQHFRNYEKL